MVVAAGSSLGSWVRSIWGGDWVPVRCAPTSCCLAGHPPTHGPLANCPLLTSQVESVALAASHVGPPPEPALLLGSLVVRGEDEREEGGQLVITVSV